MKKAIIFILSCFLFPGLYAQEGTIKGTVTDVSSGETLIGVNVVYGPGKGTVTDVYGNYLIELEYGTYTLKVSYVGYETQTRKVTLNKEIINENFKLKTVVLSEVEVIADMAKTRETPVAFTNVTPVELAEELASQDLPMILNKTPGVYATQQGGGDGDARINIRGFNQRNIAVMIDGIPVNDMENGWVYWSNWFGLDAVTRNYQVQRGLGASKLAIPSVGGTMNIITKGIANKREFSLKQEVGNDGFMRTTLGINSGQLKNGWGITFSGSYKRGDGWVDQNWTEGWFYFLRIDKKLGNHILSVTAMGAPQRHGQRSYNKPIAMYDEVYASKHGIDTSNADYINSGYINTNTMLDKGLRYNPHWGYIKKYKDAADTANIEREAMNERENYYHKPQFSLRDYWDINDKMYMSNIAYLSIGNGGGTRARNSIKAIDYDEEGQINWQKWYDIQAYSPLTIDPKYSDTEHKSSQFIRSAVNNHFWYGMLSSLTWEINDQFTFSGGIDLRSYKGEHYSEVYYLIGGDYAVDLENKNASTFMRRKGDKINYHNDGLVRWGGLFGQLEYKAGNLSAFVNISAAYSGYKRIDYFLKKQLEIGDTTLNIGYLDTIVYQGVKYTREAPGLKNAETDWKWIAGFTAKGGVNYNLSETSNIFGNIGYITKAPRFNNIYDYYNKLYREIRNEIVKAFEIGYSYYNSNITLNVNAYWTYWENKPVDRGVTIPINDDETATANINGVDALHRGIEIEFGHRLGKKIIWERLLSFGDWRWESGDSVRLYDDFQNLVETRYFDASGVRVGDAAQFQYSERIRWEIMENMYLKGAITYFAKNYADFDPLSLNGKPENLDADGNPRQSWQMPNFYLVDLHAGYALRFKKFKLDFRASVLNLLDEVYVSDAQNNDSYSANTADYDAKSAGVFFGLGRRFNTSLKITF